MSVTGYKSLSLPRHPTDQHVNRALDEIKTKIDPVLRQLPNNIPSQIAQHNQSANLLASVNPSNPATTVTGSKSTSAAITSLIAVLVKHGFIVDGTS